MFLKLKDLRARYLGQHITVEGTVNKISTQYPFCTKAVFQCEKCGYKFITEQKSLKLKEPVVCEK